MHAWIELSPPQISSQGWTNALFPPFLPCCGSQAVTCSRGSCSGMFFLAVLQSFPSASGIDYSEESPLYAPLFRTDSWVESQQIPQGSAVAPQAPPCVTHILCHKWNQGWATLSPRSCLLMTYFRIHAASSAGTGLGCWTARLSSGCNTAREACYWQRSFGTSQCSLLLNHWDTNTLYSKSVPIPPAPYGDSWDRGIV